MKKLFLLLTIFLWTTMCKSQSADVDYIILKSGVDGLNRPNNAQVAFYIDVTDSLNFAGINFRVVATRVQSDTSQINWLTGTLFDSLAIGAKLEIIRTVRFDAALTKVQKRDAIDKVFTDNLADFLEKWYAEHDFYGFERIVP